MGILSEVHIADIHFGAIDPKIEYQILEEQFLSKVQLLPTLDILSIDGDLFDHKFLANSDVVMYALLFIDRCVSICYNKGATLVVIAGTESHDAGQIKLLYPYIGKTDIRIVEHIQFEYIKGAKILCIPEEYGKGRSYYEKYLYLSGPYDSVFMHGTIKGSVYGANEENLDSNKYPIFSINSFRGCRGPIIAGHVHKAGCYETYMYYCSSPIRYKFGEEEDKGFIILLHDLNTGYHYMDFETIESFRYDTISLDAVQMSNDPNQIIQYLNNLQTNGIDHIKVRFDHISPECIIAVKNYYQRNRSVVIENMADKQKAEINTTQTIMDKYKDMDFLLDSHLSEYEKFVRYINYNKGSEYITVDKLKELLMEA